MKYVKDCPECHKKNEPNVNECIECFQDISMVPVIRYDEPPHPSKSPILELITHDNNSLIINESITVGREGAGNEIFKDYLTISRRHAKVQYFSEDNTWKIFDERSKNGTYIDGIRIEPECWMEIKEGSEISLSSRYKLIASLKNE